MINAMLNPCEIQKEMGMHAMRDKFRTEFIGQYRVGIGCKKRESNNILSIVGKLNNQSCELFNVISKYIRCSNFM